MTKHLNRDKIAALLRSHPLFREASDESLSRYLTESSAERCRFGAGEIAYSSESETLLVGMLLSGVARVQTSEQALLKNLSVGELFGIANLYAEDEPFPTTILTSAPSEFLFLRGDAVRSLIENDPAVLRSYLTFQSKKIVYLNRKIQTFTAGSAEKKLALFLLDHEADGIFQPPTSMSGLSELLGIGRASLYRAFDKLTEDGYLIKDGRDLILTDVEAMLKAYR